MGPTNQIPKVPKRALRASIADAPVHHDDDILADEDYIPISSDASPAVHDGSRQVVLSPEQNKVLQMVRQRQNVFFTGSAGSFPLQLPKL